MMKDRKSILMRRPEAVLRKKASEAGGGKKIIAALDVGSSKICCFIAEVKNHGTIDIIGIGHQASRGVKAGSIIDLRAAETAVSHAVESAEMMAVDYLQNQPIKSVMVNIPGTHAAAHQLSVDVKIAGHEVSYRDVRGALANSRSVVAQGKDELVHIIPAGYTLDKTRGIQDPCGMIGQNLGVNITAVTCLSSSLRHLSAIVGQNHLELDGFCSASYASGLASLSEDEMQLGCTVIDMGGGTTSIAVFFEGKLVYTAAIPVGGMHVTNDIARGLTTSVVDAERIKTLYGSARAAGTDDSDSIDVPPVGENEHSQPNYVPRSFLAGIIQPRIEETFELVQAKLVDSGIGRIAGRRAVLTGGASQLQGVCEIGQLLLNKQIRLGMPQRVKGLAEATGGPAFSTAAGLLIYAAEHADEIPVTHSGHAFSLPATFNSPRLQKVAHWLKENW